MSGMMIPSNVFPITPQSIQSLANSLLKADGDQALLEYLITPIREHLDTLLSVFSQRYEPSFSLRKKLQWFREQLGDVTQLQAQQFKTMPRVCSRYCTRQKHRINVSTRG